MVLFCPIIDSIDVLTPMTLQKVVRYVRQAIYCIFLVGFSASASSENVKDVLERTTIAAVVNIFTASAAPIYKIDNGCGYAYSAFVDRGLRNAREGEIISFRSELPLEMAGTYLVFLSDKIETTATESTLFGENIRSPRCAETDIVLTPVQYLRGTSISEGPEIILERRVFQSRTEEERPREVEYLSTKRIIDKLFRPAPAHNSYPFIAVEIEVERATFVSREVAYERDAFLSYIDSVIPK